MNPLLDTTSLPHFGAIDHTHVSPAIDEMIARHDEVVAALIASRPEGFAETWLPLEQIDADLDGMWSTVSHLHGVADTPELRAAHAAGKARLVEHGMRVGQNRDLFELYERIAASPEFTTLSAADQAAVRRAIRGFTLSGVALEPAARERFSQVAVELSTLSNAFSSAVLDATEAWSEHVTDPAVLAGLSEADLDMFTAAAAAKGLDGWLITLQQPSMIAVMTFAENRDLRERVYRAYGTRASDQGPNAGEFDNGERIRQILALRHESARLLGFADPVAKSLSTKMANDGDEILAFLRDLARRARPFAEAEVAEVRNFAAEHLGLHDFQPWDMTFASNRLRMARHAIDEQVVRAYFPVERVVAGWKKLLRDLFGIDLVARDDVATWHADATYYDVADEDGTVFAGLYVDLHARTGKRGGAWMAQSRSLMTGDRPSLPVAYLTCNFAPAGGTTPSLLSHNDIGTLLHEMGHCLHHLFGLVDRPIIGGVNGYEWDAIELPSQLMEDFAWDRDVLTGMSGHYETGEPLPSDLFDRMIGARDFQSGLFLLRQIEFAMFDIILHSGALGDDPQVVLDAVRDEIAVTRPPEWHRFASAFSHIFSGGYAAGYYSYLWAELLAADAFGRFVEAGLVDRATGNRLREEILSRGASRPAIESFRAFMGRDPDPSALLRRHGLV